MDPLTIGLITGGASLLGNLFSSTTAAQTSQANTQAQIQGQESMQMQTENYNAQQAGIQRDFGASQAQIQRDYETQMSNTAYQRASADMQKAGLNPMMMFGSGGAASTPSVGIPSGAAASVGTPTVPMPTKTNPMAGFASLGDAVTKAVNSAVDMKTFDKMTQEIANLKTSQKYVDAQAVTEGKRPALVEAETERGLAGASHTMQDIGIRAPEAISAKTLADHPDLLRAGTWTKYGAGTLGDMIAPFISGAGAVRRYLPETTTREGSRTSAGPGSFDEFYRTRTGLY